ncbi:MAG TPA: hypothetical protein VMG11_15575 [Steroidobacteraceae bacterium]|nr:hypothetical protein [Steroidobacteraceae bacterium]
MAKAILQPKPADANTVALERHALGTLQYIRASIEAAGMLAVPGSAGIALGTIGVCAALLVEHPALRSHWFPIWIAAGLTGLVSGTAMLVNQTRRTRAAIYRGPARKFLMCLCPALLAGAVLTVTLWQRHDMQLIPGVWLLLYGCAVAAASTMTVRAVSVMGALFVALGIVALQLPPHFSNIVLGIGFGGLHLAFGIIIGRVTHDR